MKIVVLKGSPRPNGNSNSLGNGIWANGAIQGSKFMDMAYKYGRELKK